MFRNKNALLIALSLLCLGLLAALLSMYYHTRQNTAFVPTSEEQLQKGVMRGSGRGMLISRLGFDEEQVAAFDILRADYQQQTQELLLQLSDLRAGVVAELMREKPDSAVLSGYACQMGETEASLKGLTFVYLTRLRSLCKPMQQDAFSGIVSDILTGPASDKPAGQGRGYRYRHGQGNRPR